MIPDIQQSEQEERGGALVRRPRRWVLIAAAAAIVVTVAGAVIYSQQPKEKLAMPDSACWGILSRADLEPVAGSDGTMIVSTDQSLTGAFHLKELGSCDALWSGKHDGGILFTAFATPTSLKDAKTQIRPPLVETRWSPQVTAVSSLHGTELYYACAYPSSITNLLLKFEPYVEVQVNGSTKISSHGATEARQAYAAMALKIAKAVARQLPCTNTINFPATAPAVPAVK